MQVCISTAAVTLDHSTQFESLDGALRTAPLTGLRPTPGIRTGEIKVTSRSYEDRRSVESKIMSTLASPSLKRRNK
ncbi:unnamed protein product, partial [Ixodes hexagonus]